jgi:hypothetical protein
MNITVIQKKSYLLSMIKMILKIHVCIYPIHLETKVNIFSNNWNDKLNSSFKNKFLTKILIQGKRD